MYAYTPPHDADNLCQLNRRPRHRNNESRILPRKARNHRRNRNDNSHTLQEYRRFRQRQRTSMSNHCTS